MRKAGGYLVISDPKHNVTEYDTFTCAHCNSVVIVKPKQDPSEMGGFCLACGKHICSSKKCHAKCAPFLKKLEIAENRDRLRRQIFGG